MDATTQLVESMRYEPEVAGLIFRRLNPSGRTQPLTRISHGGKDGRVVGLTIPHSYVDCLRILGASNSWHLQGLSRAVQGLIYLYLCHGNDDGYVWPKREGRSTFVCNVSIFIEGLADWIWICVCVCSRRKMDQFNTAWANYEGHLALSPKHCKAALFVWKVRGLTSPSP